MIVEINENKVQNVVQIAHKNKENKSREGKSTEYNNKKALMPFITMETETGLKLIKPRNAKSLISKSLEDREVGQTSILP